MSNYEATRYNFDAANLTGIEGLPTATVVPWSDSSVPSGFLECNGQAVSRSTYAVLFGVIATTYGSGNGSTTFNVPDFKDRTNAGRSNSKALASTGGANTVQTTGNVAGSTGSHTLTTPEMASHSHPKGPTGKSSLVGGNFSTGGSQPHGYAGPGNTGSQGSGSSHDHNMSATFTGDSTSVVQPYLTLMYIIKT
jgi:microcystin-dependent protein